MDVNTGRVVVQIIFSICIICFCGCRNDIDQMQGDLDKMRADLETRIETLKEIQEKVAKIDFVEKGDFIHSVYFNLKKDLSNSDKEKFMNSLDELKKIPEAKSTQIGIPMSTGDKRLRADYDVVLNMSFNNIEDYQTYQRHEIHLEVKKRIGSMLSAAPFVYDSLIE